jgi:hypothetical protein
MSAIAGEGKMIGIESGNLIDAWIQSDHAPRPSIGADLTQSDPFSGKAHERIGRESPFVIK